MSCVPSQDLPDRQMVASLVQALPPVIIQLRYILEELHSMRYKVEKYLANSLIFFAVFSYLLFCHCGFTKCCFKCMSSPFFNSYLVIDFLFLSFFFCLLLALWLFVGIFLLLCCQFFCQLQRKT